MSNNPAAELHQETKNLDQLANCDMSLYSNAQMGAAAARMAFELAGIKIGVIGMVISGSSAPNYMTISEAAKVIVYRDYPRLSPNSIGGIFRREL
ncbi:MAG: hypothetical protein CSYNP_04221 [Syntrophus sp. SKADARSKE-3]|nr:hypothetical protein [Syntrophus sp. SKADARSKE-3]